MFDPVPSQPVCETREWRFGKDSAHNKCTHTIKIKWRVLCERIQWERWQNVVCSWVGGGHIGSRPERPLGRGLLWKNTEMESSDCITSQKFAGWAYIRSAWCVYIQAWIQVMIYLYVDCNGAWSDGTRTLGCTITGLIYMTRAGGHTTNNVCMFWDHPNFS